MKSDSNPSAYFSFTFFLRGALMVWIYLAFSAVAYGAFDPAATFDAKCSTCHSVGHGIVVGPDLEGVTARHDAPWLHAFIRSSQTVIRAGDPSAVALFGKFQRVMPDHPFSDAEIDALLAYIRAGAPSPHPEETIRAAATASPREIERGRDLFFGRAAFARGGAACAHCHTVGPAASFGGSLASDLSGAYSTYRDWGLTRALERADFPMMARVYRARPLSPEEVFAVKAFLYQSASQPAAPKPPMQPMGIAFALLGLGGFGSMLLAVRRGPRVDRRSGRRLRRAGKLASESA